jgi:predicted ATPase
MAPEQIRGELCDARADLYSLGCILYELCTGRPPFFGRPMQVLRQHLSAAPAPPSGLVAGVPAELEALILRLLAKEPQQRVGHADDVAVALAGLGAEADPEPSEPRPRPYLYRPRFVGRERPLGELVRRLGSAEEGSGALVLIGGESGSGKTRLLMELAGVAQGRGLHVLAGECVPRQVGTRESGSARAPRGRSDRSPLSSAAGGPLEALRRPLQALADRCRELGRAETDRLLGPRGGLLALYEPALRSLPGKEAEPGPSPPDSPLSAEEARLHLFRALAETLHRLAEPGSAAVLLVLDDLHWADELTVGFLSFLAQSGQLLERRLLAVGAYRSEEAASLRELLERAEVVRLALGRLEERSVGSMVADMLGMLQPPERFVRFLTRHSEGNAFFVAEYLRTAIAREVLYRGRDGLWQVAEPGSEEATEEVFEALPLPGSVRSLVARRIEGLGADARRFAEAAAVIGREMDEELAATVARLSGLQRLEAVQELLAREVLEEAGPGRLRFVHDKVREVAYGELREAQRVQLHRGTAEAISALHGPEREEHLAEIGQHWERAGSADRARPLYLQAARGAASRHALAEGERLYRAYLSLVPKPGSDSVAARHELGGLLRLQGRPAEAVQELRQALEHSHALGDRRSEAQTLQKLGIACHEAGRLDEALAVYEQARAVACQLGDRRLEALNLHSLAVLHKHQDRIVEARGLYEQTLSIQREIGDRAKEMVTLSNLALLQAEQGQVQEARDRYEEALRVTREFGDRACEGNILINLGLLEMDQGRFEQAQALCEQALGVLRQIGHRPSEGSALLNLAVAVSNQGKMQEAQALYEESLAILRSTGNRRSEALILANLAALRRDQGALAEARLLFGQALALAREVRSRVREGVALREMAALERLAAGELARAEALVLQAASILEQVRYPIPLALCHCEQGHIELAQGRSGRPFLRRARKLASTIQIQPGSELGKAIDRLSRAIEAFEAGRPLLRGDLVQDLPEGLRRRLKESGELPGANGEP